MLKSNEMWCCSIYQKKIIRKSSSAHFLASNFVASIEVRIASWMFPSFLPPATMESHDPSHNASFFMKTFSSRLVNGRPLTQYIYNIYFGRPQVAKIISRRFITASAVVIGSISSNGNAEYESITTGNVFPQGKWPQNLMPRVPMLCSGGYSVSGEGRSPWRRHWQAWSLLLDQVLAIILYSVLAWFL